MLFQLRDYIKEQGVVSSQQLSRLFQIDVSALTPMLTYWERKGVILLCEKTTGCNSPCGGCRENLPSFYQYQTVSPCQRQ